MRTTERKNVGFWSLNQFASKSRLYYVLRAPPGKSPPHLSFLGWRTTWLPLRIHVLTPVGATSPCPFLADPSAACCPWGHLTGPVAMFWEASVYPSELRTGHPPARTKATTPLPNAMKCPQPPLPQVISPAVPSGVHGDPVIPTTPQDVLHMAEEFQTSGFSSWASDMGCSQSWIPTRHQLF